MVANFGQLGNAFGRLGSPGKNGVPGGGGGGTDPTGEVEITGTVVTSDDNGKLNRTVYAQKFNATQYTLLAMTLTANAANGPDGETLAYAVVENSATNVTRSISQLTFRESGVTSQEHVFILKPVNRSRCVVVAGNTPTNATNGVFAVVDLAVPVLTTGTAAAAFGTGFTYVGCDVSALADGYVKIVLKYTFNGSAYVTLRIDSGTGNAAIAQTPGGANGLTAYYLAYLGNSRATSDGTNVAANLTDESSSTRWFGRGLMAYAGLDLGSGKSATFTEVWLANGNAETVETNADAWFDYPLHMSKLGTTQLGVSRASILIGDPTGFATATASSVLTQTDYRPRFDYKAFTVTGTGRSIAVRKPGGYLSKMVAFAQADTAIASVSRPARVTITPPGGRRASGSIQVTLASRTSNAQIYYTTDGTTPDSTKTLYSAPFTLTMSGVTTLKAVAYHSGLTTAYSVVSSAIFKPTGIVANEDVYDNRGILVEAHGGNIVDGASGANSGKLFRIGASANFHTVGGFGGLPRQDMDLCLYSCPSSQASAGYLHDWTFEGRILDAPSNAGVYWYSVTRQKIIFNPNTSTWMLYAHADNAALNAGKCVIAESATSDILSAWSWVDTSADPGGVGFKDFNVALDPADNRILLIYTSSTQVDTHLSKMAADGRSAVTTIQLQAGGGREAHVLFHDAHRNGGTVAHWFWVSSETYPYNDTTDSDARCFVLTGSDPMTGWGTFNTGTAPRVFADLDISDNVYKNQPCSVFIPSGKDQIVYCGDNWFNTGGGASLYSSRDVWLPATFPTTTTFQVDVSKASTGWTISDLT